MAPHDDKPALNGAQEASRQAREALQVLQAPATIRDGWQERAQELETLLAAGEARAAALQLTNDRLRLSWREDVAEEKLRADKAEAAIVSLQAERHELQTEYESFQEHHRATEQSSKAYRHAAETWEKEAVVSEAELATLQAQLQAITQEMWETIENVYAVVPLNKITKWADALDAAGKD